MTSRLTWIDHDSQARERSLRILALGREKESRDELGIGGIRDSIADQLFPGTSTIQTRLRYMLFVPWIYRALEERRVSPARFADEAKRAELPRSIPCWQMMNDSGVFGALGRRWSETVTKLNLLGRTWAMGHSSFGYFAR